MLFLKVIRKKTEMVNIIYTETQTKMRLDRELKGTTTKKSQRKQTDETKNKNDLSRMASLSDEQMQKIEALRVELFMLKRKDTSSLTMPTLAMPDLFVPPKTLRKYSQNFQQNSSTSLSDSEISVSESINLPPINPANN